MAINRFSKEKYTNNIQIASKEFITARLIIFEG
jgi:hypothetical protein